LNSAQLLFKIAICLYGLSFGAAFLSDRRRSTVLVVLCPALIVNAAAVLLRYQQAWPMLPMYLGPVALPLCLGCLICMIREHGRAGALVLRVVLAQVLMISLAAVLFPKDYYLPFVKSQTIWAHLFFLFGVAGKGCFLISAAWAISSFIEKEISKSPTTGAVHQLSNTAHQRTMRWTVWGFAFWTLAMFAGQMWSYLGWGTPVVWQDPAITTTMATWFFYICLLHLHLIGSWTARSREIYAAAGALVIFILNCIPDLGPFRWPL
jgi:ABC-type transport system involved in cytochrome c biogenesis permease subunit